MATNEPGDANTSTTTADMIPLLEERLRIDKREVVTGLAKVHVTVTEHDETAQALLTRQNVAVDRVPIGAFVNEVPAVRQEGDILIVPIVEERLVVEKRLFLTEELRIRIDTERRPETHTVRLRREHAEIDLQQPIHPTKTEGTSL